MNKYTLHEKTFDEIFDLVNKGKIDLQDFEHWYESSTNILLKKEIEELNYKLDQKFDEGYDDGYSDGQRYSEVEDEKERVREYRKAYDQGFEVGYERGFNNAKSMENKGC